MPYLDYASRWSSASCTILSSIAHCAPSMTGSSVRFSAIIACARSCACQREDGIERLGRDAHGLPVHLDTEFLRHAAHGLVRHVQTDLGQDAHGCIVNAYDLVIAQYADIRLNLVHGSAFLFFPPVCQISPPRAMEFAPSLLSFYVRSPVCLKRDLRQRKTPADCISAGVLLVKGDLNLKYK